VELCSTVACDADRFCAVSALAFISTVTMRWSAIRHTEGGSSGARVEKGLWGTQLAVRKSLASAPLCVRDCLSTTGHDALDVLAHEQYIHTDIAGHDPVRELWASRAAHRLVRAGRVDCFPQLYSVSRTWWSGRLQMYMELATCGDVGAFVALHGASNDVTRAGLLGCGIDRQVALSLSIRIFIAVYAMGSLLHLAHNDIFAENVLVTDCAAAVVTYTLPPHGGLPSAELTLPTYGVRPLLSDFGLCCKLSHDDWDCSPAFIDDVTKAAALVYGCFSYEHVTCLQEVRTRAARLDPCSALRFAHELHGRLEAGGRVHSLSLPQQRCVL
jgi:hypothetical protein